MNLLIAYNAIKTLSLCQWGNKSDLSSELENLIE